MKIILISVFPPYRGGIAAHSKALHEHLIKKKYNVQLINYLKQYPQILFPGKNQYDDNSKNIVDSKLLINTINPITWIKTANYIIENNPDVVIFRFWNPFFGLSLGFIARYLKKNFFLKPLISICDNIIPHEKFLGSNLLTKYYINSMDGFLVQSNTVKDELLSFKSDAKIIKRFHPIYNIYGKKIDQSLARKYLNINSKHVILFFGIIRNYKGLDVLIKSINILKNKLSDFHLLIVGECYEDINKYLTIINENGLNDVVTFINEYVPNDDVHKYFCSSDVVVLPYKTASQSGVLQIAYHFDVPVVTTDVGGLSEYIDNNFSGVLINSNDIQELSKVLLDNFKNNSFPVLSKNIKKYKKKFSWEYFIEGIDEILKIL